LQSRARASFHLHYSLQLLGPTRSLDIYLSFGVESSHLRRADPLSIPLCLYPRPGLAAVAAGQGTSLSVRRATSMLPQRKLTMGPLGTLRTLQTARNSMQRWSSAVGAARVETRQPGDDTFALCSCFAVEANDDDGDDDDDDTFVIVIIVDGAAVTWSSVSYHRRERERERERESARRVETEQAPPPEDPPSSFFFLRGPGIWPSIALALHCTALFRRTANAVFSCGRVCRV
jgi:hypothetical protein